MTDVNPPGAGFLEGFDARLARVRARLESSTITTRLFFRAGNQVQFHPQ